MSPTTKFAALALAFVAVAVPAAQQADSTSSAAAQGRFTQAQLEQLVAPIALHPDGLLTQILIGSTYPLEIVQAQRWVDQNPGLAGSALEGALKTQTWDPSVKALCGFPTVLKQMSEDLDWTRDLGDAFLGQKGELMDTVQQMRKRALDAGNLKSTPQQNVVHAEGVIVVEPVTPAVVYVPAYSPLVVYGPGWYYSSWYYPYWYYPPPPGGGFVTFGIGFTWGSACWSHCDWHHHGVFVDALAYQSFTTHTSSKPVGSVFLNGSSGASSGQVEWTHDPVHRKGVTYRSPQVASTFGGKVGTSGGKRDGPAGIGGRERSPRPAPPEQRRNPGERRRPDGADAPRRQHNERGLGNRGRGTLRSPHGEQER